MSPAPVSYSPVVGVQQTSVEWMRYCDASALAGELAAVMWAEIWYQHTLWLHGNYDFHDSSMATWQLSLMKLTISPVFSYFTGAGKFMHIWHLQKQLVCNELSSGDLYTSHSARGSFVLRALKDLILPWIPKSLTSLKEEDFCCVTFTWSYSM